MAATKTWVPTETPYRVVWVERAGPESGGWRTRVETFATFAEARTATERLFPRGTFYASITLAMNAETWRDNGRWSRLGRRYPKQALKLSAAGQQEEVR
jgi:hypothetical protein